MILKDKNVLVLGMGKSGRSAARFLLAQRAKVRGIDRDPIPLHDLPDVQELKHLGLQINSEKDSIDWKDLHLLVLSPGIPSSHFLVQQAIQNSVPVIGEIELGCRMVKNPVVGITGTNGKTTVTLLVTHILNQCGKKAHALGNVGNPFTQELLKVSPNDHLVLELSSYQIETLFQPVLESALLLNITPDHLDRYGSMEAYAKVKFDIARSLKSGAPFYIEEKTWGNFQHLWNKEKPRLYGYQKNSYLYTDLRSVYKNHEKMFDLPDDLKHKKSHDLENLMGAFAICSDCGISGKDFIEGLKTFKKPSHRIEFVLEDSRGVRFYDDSKGTNLDAVIRAVNSLNQPILLIAGGIDKGAPYTPWLEQFEDKVKLICAIGQAAAKIKDQLASHIPVILFPTLEEAVIYAAKKAKKGEIVLLSPGCSSLDMFKDYVHRGNEFQRIVRALKIEE